VKSLCSAAQLSRAGYYRCLRAGGRARSERTARPDAEDRAGVCGLCIPAQRNVSFRRGCVIRSGSLGPSSNASLG
jgi:hypothetical protein